MTKWLAALGSDAGNRCSLCGLCFQKSQNRTSYMCPRCTKTFTDLDVKNLIDLEDGTLKYVVCSDADLCASSWPHPPGAATAAWFWKRRSRRRAQWTLEHSYHSEQLV